MTPAHGAVLENAIVDMTSTYPRIQLHEVSPLDLVRTCLERIEQLNPGLNAFITVLTDDALEQARLAEKEIKRADGLVTCMAFQWRSRISTIRPGSGPRPRLNTSKIAYQRT